MQKTYLSEQFNVKAKARDSYIVHLTVKPDQPRFSIIRSGDRQEPVVLQH